MIVKNESKIIKRCLDSVKHLIDSWCIIDTGSSDGTQEIIKEVLAGIPGELIERPWVNFGHNRNEGLRYAERWADWILLTDADMVLVDTGFNRNLLDPTVDGYDVIQENHSIRYYNFRLLNAKRNWKCIGVTHEYYSPADGLRIRARLDSLWFNDISDGGSKGDKFERDIKLLVQGLIDEPENHRYMFYLAQSYRR
jgi:glycosyltransferase involved in cell wall biosynthesis